MRTVKGSNRQSELALKPSLVLCVRKMELCAVRWEGFDLDDAVWRLPEGCNRNGDPIDIPLPSLAVEWLKGLHTFSRNSAWVPPARKMQDRMVPHIQEGTLPVALAKVRVEMPDMPNSTIYDFRRIACTHLAISGAGPVVAERCPSRRIKGMEGIYNRHQHSDGRKAALVQRADLLVALESGKDYNVAPLDKARGQT